MDKRRLGNTGVYLSELGFGCAGAWGRPFFDEADAEKLFYDAVEMGITYFDTGHSYHLAEQRLGHCIASIGSERERLSISTKCGTRLDDRGRAYHDYSPKWLRESLMTSLERLHTDHVEMLNLHGPTASVLTDEVLTFLSDVKSEGLVRAVGANSFDTDVLEYICTEKCLDFVMLDYNVLRQDREDLIRRLDQNGIGVIAGMPLAQSLCSKRVFRVRSFKDLWYLLRALKNSRSLMKKGFDFRFLEKVDGATANQLALRFVLDSPYISSAVFGTTDPAHLAENIEAVDISLPDDVREMIVVAGKGSGGASMDR